MPGDTVKWMQVLPTVLLRLWVTPRAQEKASPFETLHGKPSAGNLAGKPDQMHVTVNQALTDFLSLLAKTLSLIHRYILVTAPIPLPAPVHSSSPGD